MLKKFTLLLLCGALCFISTGCASIIAKGEKSININSKPTGMAFDISDRNGKAIHHGTTPTQVTLKKGAGWFKAGDYTISFDDLSGKKTMPMKQGVEWGWYGVGNAIFGGLIGWVIVDPLTGAMYTLEDVNYDSSVSGIQKTSSLNNQNTVALNTNNKALSCNNCKEEISKSEKAFVHQGNIVCSQCYSKLNQKQ